LTCIIKCKQSANTGVNDNDRLSNYYYNKKTYLFFCPRDEHTKQKHIVRLFTTAPIVKPYKAQNITILTNIDTIILCYED